MKRDHEQQVGRRSASPLKKTELSTTYGTPSSSVACDSSSKLHPRSKDDIVDFLRTRPQVASLRDDHRAHVQPPKPESTRGFDGQQTRDLVEIDRFKGVTGAWQQDESIESFLHQYPVDDPNTRAAIDGWLWVGSPRIPRAHAKRTKTADIEKFRAQCSELFEAFDVQAARVESDNPGKAQGVITRKLSPYRERLESDLLSTAVKHGVTSGKWMLFPKSIDLSRFWCLVATATSKGKLGPVSKAATREPDKDETLICIYTYDFTDDEETRRVLNELVKLGLASLNAKPIYYKTDAYTHLDLTSQNQYKLRASLYSSRDVLNNEVKAFKDGPVSRLKKLTKTMNEGFTSLEMDDIT